MPLDFTLFHVALDPFSRQVRLALGEKKLAFAERAVRPWVSSRELVDLNPSGVPPVLVEGRGPRAVVVCESRAALAHLEERAPEAPLLPADPAGRAEARRLLQWFDRKFDAEVNALLLHEKVEKRLLGLGAPDLAALRQGREALRGHLRHVETLLGARDWLAGGALSLADFAGAAHLSVIDYLGETPWAEFPLAKTWYAKIKSRPAFRPILTDRLPGLPPAPDYGDLDF